MQLNEKFFVNLQRVFTQHRYCALNAGIAKALSIELPIARLYR